MRWVRFDAGDASRIGRLDGDVVLPVAADRIQDVIAGRGMEPAGSELPVADLRLVSTTSQQRQPAQFSYPAYGEDTRANGFAIDRPKTNR